MDSGAGGRTSVSIARKLRAGVPVEMSIREKHSLRTCSLFRPIHNFSGSVEKVLMSFCNKLALIYLTISALPNGRGEVAKKKTPPWFEHGTARSAIVCSTTEL